MANPYSDLNLGPLMLWTAIEEVFATDIVLLEPPPDDAVLALSMRLWYHPKPPHDVKPDHRIVIEVDRIEDFSGALVESLAFFYEGLHEDIQHVLALTASDDSDPIDDLKGLLDDLLDGNLN